MIEKKVTATIGLTELSAVRGSTIPNRMLANHIQYEPLLFVIIGTWYEIGFRLN